MLFGDAPSCPVHVSARMQLSKSSEPLFIQVSNLSKFKTRKKEAEGRRIWRCPIPGCPRVEDSDIVNPWERFELAGQK